MPVTLNPPENLWGEAKRTVGTHQHAAADKALVARCHNHHEHAYPLERFWQLSTVMMYLSHYIHMIMYLTRAQLV